MRTTLGRARVALVAIVAMATIVAVSVTGGDDVSADAVRTAGTTTTTTVATPTPTTAKPAPTTTIGPPLVAVIAPATPARPTPGAAGRGPSYQATDTIPVPTTTTLPPPPPDWILPGNSGAGRRVVYSKSVMRVWTVEADNTVSRTYLVSGRRTWNQPSPGTYSVFSRSPNTCNINNPNICMRYMVRFTKGPEGDNIGFHEIPVNKRTGAPVQSLSQLGQALSGGCVRQAPDDAWWMWGWAPVGTPVVVLG